MTSKEALKSMCNHCEKLSIRDGFIGCPYRCISNDYCEEFEVIKKELEVLDIIKESIKEKLNEILELCELTEEKYQIKPRGFLIDNYLRIQDDINQIIKEWLDHD